MWYSKVETLLSVPPSLSSPFGDPRSLLEDARAHAQLDPHTDRDERGHQYHAPDRACR